ncbi:MAG TPA: GAF and ANTAR domain-containing protein [Streptosporangiaceae bacterium]|nr:GAF and ANTAR domain-containing protein [Streptosporangiaceae bacterium]
MSVGDPRIRDAFIELADTLVADYDLIDFLHVLTLRTVELLDVTACGLLVADHRGVLNLVAASSEQMRLLELFQLQNAEGPCLDSFNTQSPVQCPDLSKVGDRWPHFAPRAIETGYIAVQALPMRLRESTIGAVNLFNDTVGVLDPEAIALGQALADIATIGILQERAIRRQEEIVAQLQGALNSRVLIEQAKGVLAERLDVSVDHSFGLLRDYSRDGNHKLRDVAADVVGGRLHLTARPPRERGHKATDPDNP